MFTPKNYEQTNAHKNIITISEHKKQKLPYIFHKKKENCLATMEIIIYI